MQTFRKTFSVLNLRGVTLRDDFWVSMAKIFFLPQRAFTRKTNLGTFLFQDSIVRNNYGTFFCRKRSSDLGFVSGSFESEIVNIFKQVSGIVVDCGAHIGKYTILASKATGKKGKVIAIEPHPENYEVLIKNVKLNKCRNITPLMYAVCNKEGRMRLNIGKNNTEHSMKIDYGESFIEVDATTLDSLFRKLKLKRVDWLKIDVEGVEVETLLGARKSLKAGKIKNIVIELHDPKKVGRGYEKKIASMLKRNGYSVEKIKNYYVAKLKEEKGKKGKKSEKEVKKR
jgi:FkbM family methyltransferase